MFEFEDQNKLKAKNISTTIYKNSLIYIFKFKSNNIYYKNTN